MSWPRVVRRSFRTTQPEQAREFLLNQGARHVTVQPDGLRRFFLAVDSFDGGMIVLRDLEQTGTISFSTTPNEKFRAAVVSDGCLAVSNGRRKVTVSAGESLLIGSRPSHDIRLTSCRIRVVDIDAPY